MAIDATPDVWHSIRRQAKKSVVGTLQNINIIVHDEDGQLWAESPNYPGCFTQASSMSELIRNWAEAVCGWLETAGELQVDGLDPYHPGSVSATQTAFV